MIRPKNFRQLRKSVIHPKDQMQDTSSHQTQPNMPGSSKRISLAPPHNHSQENLTPNYTSPMDKSNKSPNQKQIYLQHNLQHNTNQIAIPNNISQTKIFKDTTRKNFLQFQNANKRKLNFQHLPQQFIKERLSSKKKQSLGPISFKNIIQNSPQCRDTSRDIKMRVTDINQHPQTQRQPQKKSSLNKLKNQFVTIKQNLQNNIKQMNSQPVFKEIILEKNRSQKTHGEIISFSKKIIKKGSNSTIFKQNIENCLKQIYINKIINQQKNYDIQFYNPFNHNKEIYESRTDIVNISRDSQLGSHCSDLDMSPCL